MKVAGANGLLKSNWRLWNCKSFPVSQMQSIARVSAFLPIVPPGQKQLPDLKSPGSGGQIWACGTLFDPEF
jgi:hypothetical protein